MAFVLVSAVPIHSSANGRCDG